MTGPKTAAYFQKTRDGKLLLRKVMQRSIPEAVTRRINRGFSAPDVSWFKGESIDYVRRKLYKRDARIFEYVDRKALLKLVDEHLAGKQNRRPLIWSLLNLEHWCERYLEVRTDS